MSNQIITENLNTGDSHWKPNSAFQTFIQAYCDKVSYSPGETVSFSVSVQAGGSSYSIKVYRLGDYNGAGGCIKTTINNVSGTAQGYYDGAALQSCPTAIIDSTTHCIEAGWSITDTWTIPGGACTGIYLALIADGSNHQTTVNFVVKGNAGADYCFVHPTEELQAYNDWGGYSLYTDPTVGVKVSYNRPNTKTGGAGRLLEYGINIIQWMEKQGYNVTYYADIDIHATPSLLLDSKALIATNHDEYWTKERYDGWQTAISAGVSSAFLGADICYWQCRLSADTAGHANRNITCYKVTTVGANLALDPFYGVDNTRVTSQWRDAVLNRPENAMIGIMFTNFNSSGNTPWTTDAAMDTTYTAGTGLVGGQSYGTDLVGYEWDAIQSGSPAGLKTIGTTTTLPGGVVSTSNTTWYKASSGALVFATGSVGWTYCLTSYRWTGSAVAPVPGMQVLLANIMGALKGPVFSMFTP